MLGHQVYVDVYKCDPHALDNPTKIESAINTLASCIDATVIQVLTHRFCPQGVSCIAQISASHIAIHTWPEHRFVTIDIFACNSKIAVAKVNRVIEDIFTPVRIVVSEADRGIGLSSPYFQER